MSNELAIAAVTIAMRNLLDEIQDIKNDLELYNQLPADLKPQSEIKVTNLPLDSAYDNANKDKNYVNLFLYHVEHNSTWRNMDIPGKIKQGETGHVPLALNLYYIITAYGENGKELIGHLLLGKAMSILHDHMVLGREEIRTAFELSELHKQVERVRITPQPISLDEVSKLWTGFQTQYRLSAAYEVSVVLIESKRRGRTPLPVLTRGDLEDKGVTVQADLLPPYPTLESVIPPKNQPSVLPGDIVFLTGHHLKGDAVVIRFVHPLLTDAIEIPVIAADRSEKKIKVTIPNQPADWPAGFYKISARITKAGEQIRTTNEIPLIIAPRIKSLSTAPLSPPVTGGHMAAVTCSPQAWPEQNVSLLLNEREFPAHGHPTKTDALAFKLTEMSTGDYFARLRIDGVDSLLVDRSGKVPVFDPSQKVSVP